MSGWPTSLLDWVILFLLPLPWWGPVVAPASIALLMIAWGTLATASPDPSPSRSESRLWPVAGLGAALALYVFMADALRAVPDGLDAVRMVLPETFNWSLFLVALALMAAPVAPMGGTAIHSRFYERQGEDNRTTTQSVAADLLAQEPPSNTAG